MNSINSMNSTNLLITGGCGFIGLNLIKLLIDKGYQNLRILDNLSIGTKESLESLLSQLGTFTKRETESLVNYSLTLNSINSINSINSLSPQSSVLMMTPHFLLLTSHLI